MDENEGSERSGAGGLGTEGIEAAGDAVLGALGLIRSGIAHLTEAALWARSDAASRDGVREGFSLLQLLDSAWLGLVADLDSRPDAVPGARAGKIAQTFLKSGLLRTAAQASLDVRAAHALAPDADPCEGGMPALGRAFATGRTSREHVEMALRAVRKLPKKVLREPVPTAEEPTDPAPDHPSGPDGRQDAEDPQGVREVPAGEAVDAFFANQSQHVDPTVTGRLARHLLDALDPDGHDGFDPEAHERRQLTHSTDGSGMIVGRFQLDPECGAWFVSAIEHFPPRTPRSRKRTKMARAQRCATPAAPPNAVPMLSHSSQSSRWAQTRPAPARVANHPESSCTPESRTSSTPSAEASVQTLPHRARLPIPAHPPIREALRPRHPPTAPLRPRPHPSPSSTRTSKPRSKKPGRTNLARTAGPGKTARQPTTQSSSPPSLRATASQATTANR